MVYPCDVCEKIDTCSSTFICPKMKIWLAERKKKKPGETKKGVFITNKESCGTLI